MKDAIIVDIDGTAAICIGEHRQAYDYSLVGNDKPNEAVFINIFSFWSLHPDGIVFFFSGRENVTFPGKSDRKDKSYRRAYMPNDDTEYPNCYELTLEWLRSHSFEYGLGEPELYMREEGDNRKDSIVKKELYRKYIHPNYYVRLVLDDRNQVVDMWRSLGLPCWQVAPGNF